jgi:D-3-phosphoglycerate dehydrogenase
MPHILVAGRIHPAGTELLDAAEGFTWEMLEEVSEVSCAARIGAAEAVILRTQPLTAATLARAPRLRLVSRHGVGFDAVDRAALRARGVALCVVGDVNSTSVAEHAMMLLLACLKRLRAAEAAARDPALWAWRDRLEPLEAAGRRLLVLGHGRAGRRLAGLAAAFGMEVRAFDPPLLARGWPEGPAAPEADLAAGLAWADAVSVHLPAGDRPLLGAAEIARMRPGAILINTARGGVVDEAALAAALREGRLGGAGLDVLAAEPPPPDHPLLGLPGVVVTPHVAGLTAEAGARMAAQAVRNVLDFFAGRLDPALLVEPGS